MVQQWRDYIKEKKKLDVYEGSGQNIYKWNINPALQIVCQLQILLKLTQL